MSKSTSYSPDPVWVLQKLIVFILATVPEINGLYHTSDGGIFQWGGLLFTECFRLIKLGCLYR